MALFSAPKFLAMPAVGMDISAGALRFLELGIKNGQVEVTRYATREFPIGTIAEGHIREKKKLQDVIATLAYEYKLSFANVALPEEQAYLVNMKLPRVDAAELRGAIEIKLEEYVPISGADAIFDYVVVTDTGKKRDSIDVVVSVLPRSVIDEYLEVFSGTGITPKAFEFESQAMARSIIPRGDNGTFLVIDIGKMVTDIFVCANSVVQFSASLDIGGHYVTQAIERDLKVSYEEAEKMKADFGLVGGEKERALHEAMMKVIGDLRTRLMQHYSYWQTHHSEKIGGSIECIYLTGGGANLKGLSEYLSMGLDVQVKTANPWSNVNSFEKYIPPIPFSTSLGYAAAIGLALRNISPL